MPFIVIGGLLCLSSSVGAALMMGGGKEEGAVCTPEGTPDPNATYKYDADGDCVMTCKSGYLKEDGVCVEEVKFNVPIHCIVGGTPSGMLQYGKLYAEKTGGKNAQEFFNSDAAKRMFLEKDDEGIPTGKGRVTDPDDHAGNIKYIYDDIYRKTGEYPTFMAVTTRYLEHADAANGNVWFYTLDPNWTPDADTIVDMNENYCSIGRDYMPVGAGGSSSAKFKAPGRKNASMVYDTRDASKLINYSCNRPEAGEPGSGGFNFAEIDHDPTRATNKCREVMNCQEGEQCYATMARGEPEKYGCVKCEPK